MLTDNLYNCWEFEGSLSGNNGKAFSISNPQYEVGKFDLGLRCNSSDESAGAAVDTLDFLAGGGSWCGAMWVKMVALPTGGIVLLTDNRKVLNGGFWLTVNQLGSVMLTIKEQPAYGKQITSNVLLVAGNWNLIIFGYDAATSKSFIRINDTHKTFGNTFIASPLPVSPLTIGIVFLLNSGVPNAIFDTYALWRGRVLEESEMQALWNGGAGLNYPFS